MRDWLMGKPMKEPERVEPQETIEDLQKMSDKEFIVWLQKNPYLKGSLSDYSQLRLSAIQLDRFNKSKDKRFLKTSKMLDNVELRPYKKIFNNK